MNAARRGASEVPPGPMGSSARSAVGVPDPAAWSASRGPVVMAGESSANEITRTACGRPPPPPVGMVRSRCRKAHSSVARGRSSIRARQSKRVMQRGDSSEAMTGAPATRAISSRRRNRRPFWRRMSTNAVLPNSPITIPIMPAAMGGVSLEAGWVVAFCSIRVVLTVEPVSS